MAQELTTSFVKKGFVFDDQLINDMEREKQFEFKPAQLKQYMDQQLADSKQWDLKK